MFALTSPCPLSAAWQLPKAVHVRRPLLNAALHHWLSQPSLNLTVERLVRAQSHLTPRASSFKKATLQQRWPHPLQASDKSKRLID